MFDTQTAHAVPSPRPLTTKRSSTGERQFIEALPLITNIIDVVCRHQCVPGGDDDEFRSLAMVKLIENDYQVLRRFSGRSTLRTYLVVVLQRVLLDHRIRQWGKWRPSVEARRRGPVAVRLEQMTVRDGMSLDEAVASLRTNYRVTESSEALHALASHLPHRRRVRIEPEDALTNVIDNHPLPDAIVEQQQDRTAAAAMRAALRNAISALSADERLIVKLRFVDGLTVVEIAGLLRMEVKPLYRRLDRILSRLREQLRDRTAGSGLALTRRLRPPTYACR